MGLFVTFGDEVYREEGTVGRDDVAAVQLLEELSHNQEAITYVVN